MTRYLWVASRKAEGFPTAVSCRIAGVGRQAFYDWSDRQVRGSSLKELATAELVDEIRRIHSDSGGAYGSPRVTAVLRRHEVFLTLRDRLRVFSSRIGGCAVVVVWSC